MLDNMTQTHVPRLQHYLHYEKGAKSDELCFSVDNVELDDTKKLFYFINSSNLVSCPQINISFEM
jgi:hypothetical protein